MKQPDKHIAGYVLTLIMLWGISPLGAQEAEDDSTYITVSGTVKDEKSKKRLEYANISVPGSNIGTVTNADGEFSIKIKTSVPARVVEVSHIGYLNEMILLRGVDIAGYSVMMTPNENLLDEVIIRAREPRYIVEEAIGRIARNYSPNNSLLTGFYRETAQKGRRYINISEAVIDIYKTAYGQNADRDRVQVFKGRSLLSQKKSDTLIVKLLGGPNLSIYVDIVKNPEILLERETLS